MTTRNLFDKKVKRRVVFDDPQLTDIIGDAEMKGGWLFWGKEKNGKTWLTLQLVKDLSANQKMIYISAEEGTDASFQDAVIRSGITTAHRILWEEYMPLTEIVEKYSKSRTADMLVMDNLTVYKDEFKQYGGVKKFLDDLGKPIILIAHEERGEPYTSAAKDAKRWCKVIIHVEGLSGHVVSRFSKGGEIVIDEEGSALYWGDAR